MQPALHRAPPHPVHGQTGAATGGPDLKDLLQNGVSVIRRRAVSILVIGGILTAAVAAMVIVRENQYSASAMLLLDPRPRQMIQADAGASVPVFLDQGAIRAEIDILGSDRLVRQVVENLDLVEDPALAGPRDGMPGPKDLVKKGLKNVGTALGLVSPEKPVSPERAAEIRFQETVEAYRNRLDISGGANSFTVALSFKHPSPETAARIVNAHAAAYLEEQRSFKEDVGSSTASWLNRMLADLRPSLAEAEAAVEAARAKVGQVGRAGHELTAQQITELNTRLIEARADLASRAAKVRQVQAALRGGGEIDATLEVVESPVIVDLRGRLAGLAQRESELLMQYGPRHPAVQSIRQQIEDVERKAAQESERILRSIEGEARAARARETALSGALDELRATSAEQETARVELAALEREAASLRSVFESLLSRFQQIEVQQGLQKADARIVSEASPPRNPTFPGKGFLLAFGGVMSFGAALIVVFIHEWFASGYRSLRQVEADTGVNALWMVPKVRRRGDRLPDAVVRDPKSLGAESVRALRQGVEGLCRSPLPKVLVVTSALPGEGKSSLAVSIARSLASSGDRRVILLDCDLRRPAALHLLNGDPTLPGVQDVCRDPSLLTEAVQGDAWSPLRYISAGPGHIGQAERGSGDVLASVEFDELVRTLRRGCDWIVVDSPPVGAVADALTLIRKADATIMVVRYLRTPRALVRACLRRLVGEGSPPIAVALNQVELKKVANFTPADAEYYHHMLRGYYS